MKAQQLVDMLNDLHKISDMTDLFKFKVKVDIHPDTANDMTFMFGIDKNKELQIGALGLLNGVVEDGVVAACFDEGKLIKFQVFKGNG